MEQQRTNTLPKEERLCGKKSIENLLAHGRHGNEGRIRYIYAFHKDDETAPSRILISVPKKLFKRAVKRNLLKRRIRECWRKQKTDLDTPTEVDILFIYGTKEILTYQDIYLHISKIISKLNGKEKK